MNLDTKDILIVILLFLLAVWLISINIQLADIGNSIKDFKCN